MFSLTVTSPLKKYLLAGLLASVGILSGLELTTAMPEAGDDDYVTRRLEMVDEGPKRNPYPAFSDLIPRCCQEEQDM